MAETITMTIEEYKKLKEAVTISKAQYEEMAETIEILSDKEAIKDIEKSREEIIQGRFITFKKLKDEFRSKDSR